MTLSTTLPRWMDPPPLEMETRDRRRTYGDWEVDPTRPAIQTNRMITVISLFSVKSREVVGYPHPRMRRQVCEDWRDEDGQHWGRWWWTDENREPMLP